MSLYEQWTEMVVEYVKTKGEAAFWREYSKIETNIYKDLLAKHKEVKKTTIKELAEEQGTTVEFVMGFIDGINDSLTNPYELETLEEDTVLEFNIDLENLYYNMLDAKADYLYNLPQWAGIFSEEKREAIKKEFKESKIVRNENKVGRNDQCPCGSGKKFKKCCGK